LGLAVWCRGVWSEGGRGLCMQAEVVHRERE
jgi:hypothetical protein